ncbi:laminin subunit beta-4 [Callorhinchus milii]|nr:laminin subunit beta-4 [Callorhinchus milii]
MDVSGAYSILINFAHAQDDCNTGPCYPPLGDLLVGRSNKLSASSTCGMNGPEQYCIIGHLQDEQKCFICDSRLPYNPISSTYSHLIENVITAFAPDRKKKWWQSANGMNKVSIQLDLDALFQFSHLILSFKTFRPAAMLVERSSDYGHTWKVFRYFSFDCGDSFPTVPTGPAQKVDDVICDSKYSDLEPSTDGEVVLKALDPNFQIYNPHSPQIQELITFTNLRINFTQLHTLGDIRLRKRQTEEKYYYALYEMVIRGSCFCNGHASQCVPVNNIRGDIFSQQGMVHGKCVCQHNTEGVNCERCKNVFKDSPWQPAGGGQAHECRRCNCNGHSERCHFDMAVYLASGRVSGGVCEECQHNTMGQHCEQCRPFYYHDLGRSLSDPATCVSCTCDPEGSLSNGLCESHSDPILNTVAGRCICKRNVEGTRCDQCKPGYFGLSAVDPEGCKACQCDSGGSVLEPSACDSVTGECFCQRFVTGRNCDQCLPNYWGLGNTVYGCSPCDCDIGGAYDNFCSSYDGHCRCLPNIIGHRCNEPAHSYFFAPLDYYLYEAELAEQLGNSASLIQATSLPKCDDYLRIQGYDFNVEHGRLVLRRISKRNIRHQRKRQLVNPESRVQIVSRERVPDKPMMWTGLGFARVPHGAGLQFIVNNIPHPMNFIAVIRYEPESTEDWTASIRIQPVNQQRDSQCRDNLLSQELSTVSMPATTRVAIPNVRFCLEPQVRYSVEIYFNRSPTPNSQPSSHILIDSLGLIPSIRSLENLCTGTELDQYRQYQCVEVASEAGPQILPDVCEKLIVSMSAQIHNGAIPCNCNPQGSASPVCSRFGGQCQCKPGVIGRCCDTCVPGSYGFGSNGCSSCVCNRQGALDSICNQLTGQCDCRRDVVGRACEQCRPGYYGFPSCRSCWCNGYSELCDSQTGVCQSCQAFTTGSYCERCIDGYYGNPALNEPCHQCQCPDVPNSGQYFAHSCYEDPRTLQLVCNCIEGYAGIHCDQCLPGFYGTPTRHGDQCLQCSCNDNIDERDPEACNPQTGECVKCLYNTYGPNCQFCKPGYYGSAINKDCRECTCYAFGVEREHCLPDGLCMCNQVTGQCPCLPYVFGNYCEQCAPNFWNLGSGRGCQPCYCDSRNSINTQCDQITGQCQCKDGYGGKTCSECQDNFYGNPRGQCIPCNCSYEGTERPMCNKITGACTCRTGVTGQHCNKCDWGYCKEFPTCTKCHPCFEPLDKEICILIPGMERLANKTYSVTDGKLASSIDERLKRLEENTSEVDKIINGSVTSLDTFERTKDYFEQISTMKMQVQPNLNLTNDTKALNRVINDLNHEVNKLTKNISVIKKYHEMTASANIQGVSDSINKYYQNSKASQEKVDGSKSVNDSKSTQETTASLFDKVLLNGSNKINELKKKVDLLDLSLVNNKICGVQSNLPCHKDLCGGALCRDDYGNRRCGGPYCNGALTVSKDAKIKAEETDDQMNNLLKQLQDTINQIDSVRKVTQESKDKATRLSDKITEMKNRLKKDKEQMKTVIQKVKDFLTADNVHPEDIKKIANYVLSLSLPISAKEVENKGKEIQKILSEIQDVDKEIEKLNQRSGEAKDLLKSAKKAENAAKEIPDTIEIENNLNKIKQVQRSTEDKIKTIKLDMNNAQDRISKLDEKTKPFADNFMTLMNSLSWLNNKTMELKNKTELNRVLAENAKKVADIATSSAEEADKEFEKLNDAYDNLKKLKLQEVPVDAKQKAQKLQEEASDMAKDLEEKLKRITRLEKSLQDGNKEIEEKSKRLGELEKMVIEIKMFIDNFSKTC